MKRGLFKITQAIVLSSQGLKYQWASNITKSTNTVSSSNDDMRNDFDKNLSDSRITPMFTIPCLFHAHLVFNEKIPFSLKIF